MTILNPSPTIPNHTAPLPEALAGIKPKVSNPSQASSHRGAIYGPLSPLTQLPIEVGAQIASFLPTTIDKLNFGRTCRTAQKYVGQVPLDARKKTLMHWAAERGYTHTIEALSENDAKDCLHLKDTYGWTPLHHAVWEGRTKAVETLLKLGAKASGHLPDRQGFLLLHLAVGREGNVEIIKVLSAAGAINSASINWQDNDGMTALHYAARWGHVDIIDVLVQAGAKVNLPNNQGLTALHLASHWGHSQTVKRLINAGADIHQWDHFGQAALQHTQHWKNYRQLEVVRVLSAAAEENRAESYMLDFSRMQEQPPTGSVHPTESPAEFPELAILKNFLEKKKPAMLRVITHPARTAQRDAVVDFIHTHYINQFKCSIDAYCPEAIVMEPVLLVGTIPLKLH